MNRNQNQLFLAVLFFALISCCAYAAEADYGTTMKWIKEKAEEFGTFKKVNAQESSEQTLKFDYDDTGICRVKIRYRSSWQHGDDPVFTEIMQELSFDLKSIDPDSITVGTGVTHVHGLFDQIPALSLQGKVTKKDEKGNPVARIPAFHDVIKTTNLLDDGNDSTGERSEMTSEARIVVNDIGIVERLAKAFENAIKTCPKSSKTKGEPF